MNINLIHSKIGKEPLEAHFREFPKEIENSLNYMTRAYNPYGKKNPKIIGGRLVIENNLCIRIETTIGDFNIKSQFDIDNLLKKNIRILIKGNLSNDLSTLLRWYPPFFGYYFSFSNGIKQQLPHPSSYYSTDNILQWKPCGCHYENCPHYGIKSGWIEDIKDVYEFMGEKDNNPTPKKIEDIFSSIENNMWLREGLTIKFFSRPGTVMGKFLLLYPSTLLNPKYKGEDRNLWNEALATARAGGSLGISWLQEAVDTTSSVSEDVKSSHFSNLANTPILIPEFCHLEVIDGFGLSEQSYWDKVRSSVEIVALGIQVPPTNITPRQHRIETNRGNGWGVVPTHYPVRDVSNKSNTMDLGPDHFIPIRTFFFTSIDKDRVPTYSAIVKKLYNYSIESTPFGRYTKYLTKVGVGKLNSYWIKRRTITLRFTPELLGTTVWVPLEPLPQGYDGIIEEEVYLSPSANFLTAFSVYGREESMLRWQLQQRGNQGSVLHALKDGDIYRGNRDLIVKDSLGNFRPKTKEGQRIAVLSDLHTSYIGDGHNVNWLKYLDNSTSDSTEIKADPVYYRRGLEVFKSLPLNEAHLLLGTIENIIPECELGSKKLLGGKTEISDLKKGKKFRLAEDPSEIKEVLNQQGGEWNE